MRKIALDTETTGLSTEQGHRIIEIGCVEIIDRKLTGNTYHCYVNPQREVDSGAFAVHGISSDFLKDKPKFADIVDSLLKFIAGAELIIHNASFDVGFLNHELLLAGHQQSVHHYCTVIDTLALARRRHPGKKNTLDALCARHDVDNSHRELHGALIDADLLAQLYLVMTGGQASLFTEDDQESPLVAQKNVAPLGKREALLPIQKLSAEEERAHLNFLELLKKNADLNLWGHDSAED